MATYAPEPVVPPEPLVKEVSAAEVAEPLEPEPEEGEGGWPGERKRARAGFLGSGWIVAITLLLLIIAGVAMFIISGRQDLWDKTVAAMAADSGAAKKGTRVDSAAAATPPAATTAGPVNSAGKGGGMGTTGDSLFATLYKPYARGDDPERIARSIIPGLPKTEILRQWWRKVIPRHGDRATCGGDEGLYAVICGSFRIWRRGMRRTR